MCVKNKHPGIQRKTAFKRKILPETRLLAPKETGNFRDDVLKNWDWLNNDVFPTWTADACYTLDKIAELERTPGQLFHKRLDLSRIGMMGWSFGGAVAIQMSREDPRVKAAVDSGRTTLRQRAGQRYAASVYVDASRH
jgi:hypothetical protein